MANGAEVVASVSDVSIAVLAANRAATITPRAALP